MLSSEELVAKYRSALEHVFRGRKVIVVGGPVAALEPMGRALRELGAERPFLIGGSVGTGQLPDPEHAEWASLEQHAKSVNDAIQSYEHALLHPPSELRQRIDAWDPERKAIALGAIVLSELPTVAGRPRYGARPHDWINLEDKTRIDEVWDAAGIPRAPCAIVRPDRAELDAAAKKLDAGQGTVWVADARRGVHGGAEKLRWVRGPEDVAEAVSFFEGECEHLRVMPFLEGLPCSVHGIVLPRSVVVLRPVELMVFRRPESTRFLYAGCASYWDPADADREAMREVARRVGRQIGKRAGYRGPFSVDGIMTERGFVPTELNPRYAAGLRVLGGAWPELPLALLCIVAQAGAELEFHAEDLERALLEAADDRRGGGGWLPVHAKVPAAQQLALTPRDGGLHVAQDGEPVAARVSAGPGELGGFVSVTLDPELTPRGRSVAPLVRDAFAAVDRVLGDPIGPIVPPNVVR